MSAAVAKDFSPVVANAAIKISKRPIEYTDLGLSFDGIIGKYSSAMSMPLQYSEDFGMTFECKIRISCHP